MEPDGAAQRGSAGLPVAWVSVCQPSVADILRVKAEIFNVCDSLASGNLTLDMVNRQLLDEFDLFTDWARRDKSR